MVQMAHPYYGLFFFFLIFDYVISTASARTLLVILLGCMYKALMIYRNYQFREFARRRCY